MNGTLSRASRMTHLKIVLVSLAATTVVVMIGLNARISNFDNPRYPTGPVVKASQPAIYAARISATR